MAKVLWPRHRSRSKTAGEDQRIGDLSLLSRSVELVENLGSKNGLGSIWMFQCQNDSCPSHETNDGKKSRALTINCTSVLGFRAIDGGHAVSKVFSFLGLSPINRKLSVFPPRPA